MQSGETGLIQNALEWLSQSASQSALAKFDDLLEDADPRDIELLLQVLCENTEALHSGAKRLQILLQQLTRRLQHHAASSHQREALVAPELLADLFGRLHESQPPAAAHVLQILATQHDEESIGVLAELLADSASFSWQSVGLCLSPLWRAEADVLEFFFDRLGSSYANPATITVVLDLANYSVRSRKLVEHPLAHRGQELANLLGQLTGRLEQFAVDPTLFGSDVSRIQQTLEEGVSLTVALCDSLGLIGNCEASVELLRALELSHRRIQTEAAGALARIGDPIGRARIAELAGERVSRLRAIAYADELGFSEDIDEIYRYPQALAEAELANWLASADQFGIPPCEMELIDSRTQYWPGYEEPRDCFLFRFTYQLPSHQLTNVGIAGPLVLAFRSDLNDLRVDDVYSAFAGWQAEHEAIFEVPSAQLNVAQRREADRLRARFIDHGIDIVDEIALTFLFDQAALLVLGNRDDRDVSAIADKDDVLCIPISQSPTCLTPELALAIYRGRKLLRAFNGNLD